MTRGLRDNEYQELLKLQRQIEVLNKLVREPTPTARVNRTSDRTITAGELFVATWPVADYNTDEMWVLGAPTRLTARRAGQYAIWANLYLNISGSGDPAWLIGFNINGVSSSATSRSWWNNMTPYTERHLNEGDYVEVEIKDFRNVGGEMTSLSAFGMSMIGPEIPPPVLS